MKYESYHAISLTFLSKTSEYNSALFCNLNAILNGIIYYVIEVHLSILQKYARNKTMKIKIIRRLVGLEPSGFDSVFKLMFLFRSYIDLLNDNE